MTEEEPGPRSLQQRRTERDFTDLFSVVQEHSSRAQSRRASASPGGPARTRRLTHSGQTTPRPVSPGAQELAAWEVVTGALPESPACNAAFAESPGSVPALMHTMPDGELGAACTREHRFRSHAKKHSLIETHPGRPNEHSSPSPSPPPAHACHLNNRHSDAKTRNEDDGNSNSVCSMEFHNSLLPFQGSWILDEEILSKVKRFNTWG